MPEPIKIAVLGAGTWGATLAALLAENKHSVRLWDVSTEVMNHLRVSRIPAKLPHLKLPGTIAMEHSLPAALDTVDMVVIVIPSHAVRTLCGQISTIIGPKANPLCVVCSKGIEQKTLLPLSGVMEEVLGPRIRDSFCCLSGPSHAEEVSVRMPTSIVASAWRLEAARQIQNVFHTEYLRVYTHDDVLGVELGGSLKNVIAIAAGVCDGLGLGDNTKAALLTRGLAEMTRLGVAMGSRGDTFSGLSGMGDLIVTAMSRHSRNRNFGELLARGLPVDQAMTEIGMVVEGFRTADSVRALSEKFGVAMPISRQVYEILYCGKEPRTALKELMSRSQKPEIYSGQMPLERGEEDC